MYESRVHKTSCLKLKEILSKLYEIFAPYFFNPLILSQKLGTYICEDQNKTKSFQKPQNWKAKTRTAENFSFFVVAVFEENNAGDFWQLQVQIDLCAVTTVTWQGIFWDTI